MLYYQPISLKIDLSRLQNDDCIFLLVAGGACFLPAGKQKLSSTPPFK